MLRFDIALWVLAVALFVGGDWVTTRYGLARDAVVERNPLARRAIDRLGVTAALLVLKFGVLAVAFAGYRYAASDPVTRGYRLLFPAVVLLFGLV